MIDQKINYIHQNPVKSGFIDEPTGWVNSSARAYEEEVCVLEVQVI